MADNTTLNTGSGGDVIRDILRVSGAKTQVVQLDAGGQAGESLVSQTNPMPVQLLDGAGLVPAAIDPAGNLYNVPQTSYDQPVFNVPVGDPNGNFAGIPIYDGLMDDDPSIRLNVKVVNQNPVILDAPSAIQINLLNATSVVLDTTGYQSLSITTQALTANVTGSNDLITWSAVFGVLASNAAGVTASALAVSSGYSFPCVFKYIRFTATATGAATLYFRTVPYSPLNYAMSVSVNQIGGTGWVTAGVSGIPSVGGNIAPGVARTANPVPVAGVDSANLTRTLLTDTTGRTQTVANAYINDPTTNTAVQPSAVYPTGSKSVPALAVQNLDQAEGLGLAELLSQVLLELKISNHYAYLLQQAGIGAPDDPSTLRGDSSIFN